MKKKYLSLFVDLKIYAIVLLLSALTGCETESPKKNHLANNNTLQQSSSSSKAVASNNVLSLPVSSSTQNKSSLTRQPPISPIKSPTHASLLSVSSVSMQPSVSIGYASGAMTSVSSSTMSIAKKAMVGVSGVIKVTGKNGEIISPEGVIVNLEPTNAAVEPAAGAEKHQHDVSMKNKTYAPKLMTIKQNDQVNFANNDKIKHNVFSTSGENRFDLGTYGEGKTNKMIFKSPGVVKVYCNIHPEMALFISVSPNNYSHITDKNGFFEIDNLPPGEYRLSAWHIRGETQQIVNLKALHTKKDMLINTEAYVPVPHKNKYDEAYKVKSVLFEDEFY
ncbi:MAG: carboxypeptidase regulatory-like domain-containing protein [Pseudomonadota bacterium]